MLKGLDPLLSGDLLGHLDRMGHSDAVVIADANFPADRLGNRVLELPGTASPAVLAAILSVVPTDADFPIELMDAADPTGPLTVQRELIAAIGEAGRVEFVDRHRFYDNAASAYLIVRTGEARAFGNALVRKGVVTGKPA